MFCSALQKVAGFRGFQNLGKILTPDGTQKRLVQQSVVYGDAFGSLGVEFPGFLSWRRHVRK